MHATLSFFCGLILGVAGGLLIAMAFIGLCIHFKENDNDNEIE